MSEFAGLLALIRAIQTPQALSRIHAAGAYPLPSITSLTEETYKPELYYLPCGGVLCHPKRPEISNFRKHGIRDIKDGTSMKFYFNTERLVGNNKGNPKP